MNVLILGDGPEERAWALAVVESPDDRLVAAWPGFDDYEEVHRPRDLDDALATAGVDLVIVGGPIDGRGEALRRAAGVGMTVIALHPPGDDSEAYYQVAMSRSETGAVIVPDLPARLHPGVAAIRDELAAGTLGEYRELRYEAVVSTVEGDLARVGFARAVDVVRSLLGEIESVTATGDPPGERPDRTLVVQLRAGGGRRAEVRLSSGEPGFANLVLTAALGSTAVSLPADLSGPAWVTTSLGERIESAAFPPREAVLGVVREALAGRDAHPNLLDGTRAMEVSEGVRRSLRRGRTVELHYEEISEEGTFKGVMTSLGCMVLFGILFVLPVALAGPPLGFPWTIYLAYLIPPALVGFVLMQTLRFAVRDRAQAGPRRPADEA